MRGGEADCDSLRSRRRQSVEKGPEPVLRLKYRGSLHIMRLELGERGGLECDMSMEIGLRRQDRLMSEPQRDHRQVDTRLEQFHRGGVSKDMRRYPLVPPRWAMCTRRPDMLCEQILDEIGRAHV